MIREIGVNELDKVHNIALDVWEKTYSSIISKEQIEFMFDKMYTLESLAEQMKSGHIFLIHETDEGINGFCSYCIEQNGVKIPKLYVSLTKQKKAIKTAKQLVASWSRTALAAAIAYYLATGDVTLKAYLARH